MIRSSFFIGAFIFFTHSLFAQYTLQDKQKVKAVLFAMEDYHIDYRKLKPRVPKRFPNVFLKLLDEDHQYLIQKDVYAVRANSEKCFMPFGYQVQNFLEQSYQLYHKALERAVMVYENMQPINFYENDSIEFKYYKDKGYAKSDSSYRMGSLRMIKVKTFERLMADSLYQKSGNKQEMLTETAHQVIAGEICYLKNKLEDTVKLKEYVLNTTLRAICQSFDPHSDFFTSETNELFQAGLSSKMISPGIFIENVEGKYIISFVEPSSSAFEEGLNQGDEVLMIFYENKAQHPGCIGEEQLMELFYGSGNNDLTITVREAKTKKIRKVTLTKKSTENSNNHTYSYLIEKGDHKFAYILFPQFYYQHNRDDNSSGQDLSSILKRLRDENTDGLVLDLRNNSGGAIDEAIELAGMFIDYGPLFITQTKTTFQGYLHKDIQKGSLYDGKVIFLVNRLSGSASEMLVSAMQYYPDRMIVGSQTFGKSTGQEIIPLRTALNFPAFGYIKITTLKIYELDGTSYQGIGVQPEVEIPDILPSTLIGENTLDNSLIHRPLRKSYNIEKHELSSLEIIRSRSSTRIARNNEFQSFNKWKEAVMLQMEEGKWYSLHADHFEPNIIIKASEFPPQSQKFTVTGFEEDAKFEEISRSLSTDISSDFILNETLNIFSDWLMLP